MTVGLWRVSSLFNASESIGGFSIALRQLLSIFLYGVIEGILNFAKFVYDVYVYLLFNIDALSFSM